MKVSPFVLGLLALGLIAGTSQAALISINTVALSADGREIASDPSIIGTVLAWNVNGAAATTVNGVTFQGSKPTSVAVTFTNGGATANNTYNPPHYTTTEMKDLMKSLIFSGPGGFISVTFNNLIEGTNYQIQMTHHQQDASSRTMQVYFGNITAVAGGGSVNVGTGGYITTANFTADATSQIFYLNPTVLGGRSVLNGVALYTIPEPASLALLMVGAACLFTRRPR